MEVEQSCDLCNMCYKEKEAILYMIEAVKAFEAKAGQ